LSEALQKIDEIERAIVRAKTIETCREYEAQLAALRAFVEKRGEHKSIIQRIAEAEILLKRRIGQLLPPPEECKGGRGRNLTTLGKVSHQDRNRVRVLAALPEEIVRSEIAKAHAKGEVISQNRLLKIAKEIEKKDTAKKIRQTAPPVQKKGILYEVIVVDPPWQYEKRKDDISHRGRCPYPTMTVAEICEWGKRLPAKADCIIWLWATNAFMRHAFIVLDEWRFKEKTILTWVKNKFGVGDWLRGQTEHCVLAVKGKPLVSLTNQSTVLFAKASKHSAKPDEFFDLVDALCPSRLRAEYFSRKKRDTWDCYGNEVPSFS
jgi:N6-adenosine-specific RNA methylase IME4